MLAMLLLQGAPLLAQPAADRVSDTAADLIIVTGSLIGSESGETAAAGAPVDRIGLPESTASR